MKGAILYSQNPNPERDLAHHDRAALVFALSVFASPLVALTIATLVFA